MKNWFYVLVVALSFQPVVFSDANAFCSEPSMYETPPSAPGSYSKPDVPFCLNQYSYTRKHTCSQWELNNYIEEINDYIRKLKAYVDEANSFANSATDFANEAAEYANCEAQDAKSAIE